MRRIAAALLLLSLPAEAGMTYVSLSDAAKARLDVLSFFLVAYLILGWIVKALWNSLAKDLGRLPALTYRRALAFLLLSGLFLYVVLTMISGARELLTPGAWEKQGIGYRLRDTSTGGESKELRKQRLENLRAALWRHASDQGNDVPLGPFSGEIPRSLWQLADGNYYGYLRPEAIGSGHEIIVYEPASAGARRYVLFSDGAIEDWAEGKLHSRLNQRLEP